MEIIFRNGLQPVGHEPDSQVVGILVDQVRKNFPPFNGFTARGIGPNRIPEEILVHAVGVVQDDQDIGLGSPAEECFIPRTGARTTRLDGSEMEKNGERKDENSGQI